MDQLLQEAVTHFTQWCNYNQMAVSPKKSDQLFICASNRSQLQPASIQIQGISLTSITRYTTTPTHTHSMCPVLES